MRVAVFTDNDFDKINGVTTALSAVIRYAPPDLSPRIYTVSALGTDHPDYLAIASAGMPIPYYRGMRIYWPPWRRFIDRARSDGVQVIHLTTPGPMGLAAVWAARRTALPLVGSFHTDIAAYAATLSGSPRLGQWMRAYLKWLYGQCQAVLVPSEHTRTLLLEQGARPEQLRVWTRGVDTDLFRPERRSDELRRAWRAGEDRPVLLYVGRLSREKGLLRLAGISAHLQRRGLDHRLVFVGDGPLRRELTEACPDAVFLGALGRAAVARAFASADIFVFPSTTDTAGNVVLEAQASGLPVVVSASGGPKENLVPDRSGLICGGDVAEWAATVSQLLMEPQARHRMGAAARAYALRRQWGTALAPLYETYRTAGATRSPPPSTRRSQS
jgi:glycosyltransferase involved in cell wall biosynthesis